MRRMVAVGTLFVLFFGGIQAAPETQRSEQKSLVKHLFGPKGFFLAAFSTAIQHIRVVPEEWGAGAAGLGKRFASSFGHHLVKGSVQYGVAKAIHEDLKYHPSDETGFRPRLKHALVSTVYTRKTTGRPAVANARISGEIAGGFISRLWQPASLHTIASGFASTGISFGVDAGMNVIREFWPEIRHPRRRLENATAQTKPPIEPQPELETKAEIEVIEIDADGCLECAPEN
jgi:hypothetical protein